MEEKSKVQPQSVKYALMQKTWLTPDNRIEQTRPSSLCSVLYTLLYFHRTSESCASVARRSRTIDGPSVKAVFFGLFSLVFFMCSKRQPMRAVCFVHTSLHRRLSFIIAHPHCGGQQSVQFKHTQKKIIDAELKNNQSKDQRANLNFSKIYLFIRALERRKEYLRCVERAVSLSLCLLDVIVTAGDIRFLVSSRWW